MVLVDYPGRQVTLKIVYCGPALSGKTTNLKELHRLFTAGSRGRLMTLDTVGDRTLFFDMLPLLLRTGSGEQGLSLAVKLYTVPGQVVHNATRRHVLTGADGVVFVADSRRSERGATEESFADLERNLTDEGRDTGEFPLVLQYNKRDLDNVMSEDELWNEATRRHCPLYPAVALRGEGVVETFFGLLDVIWESLEKRFGFASKFRVNREEFLSSLARHVDTDPDKSGPHLRPTMDGRAVPGAPADRSAAELPQGRGKPPTGS